MRGQNPLVAVGLAGLAAGLALFVVSKVKAAPTAAPAPGAPPPAPAGQPVPPFVPGVGLPQPQPTAPNAAALQAQLQALLAQVALAPQTVDPNQLDTLEAALRAANPPLTAQADQVHAASTQLRVQRGG